MMITLIIPCFNEAKRINFEAFDQGRAALKQHGIVVKYLFASDGSPDRTEEILRSYCAKSGDFLYVSPNNVGKANVIQQAFQSFKTQHTDSEWIGFWDADLATPLSEIIHMIGYHHLYRDQDVSAIWGSRVSRLGSKISRKMYRHYLSRIFVTIVSNYLNVKAYDSQCGAKLFKPEAAALAFSKPFISQWIFDVEIIFRLNGLNIIEFPLSKWTEIPGSKVKPLRNSLRVAADLYKIKKTYPNPRLP